MGCCPNIRNGTAINHCCRCCVCVAAFTLCCWPVTSRGLSDVAWSEKISPFAQNTDKWQSEHLQNTTDGRAVCLQQLLYQNVFHFRWNPIEVQRRSHFWPDSTVERILLWIIEWFEVFRSSLCRGNRPPCENSRDASQGRQSGLSSLQCASPFCSGTVPSELCSWISNKNGIMANSVQSSLVHEPSKLITVTILCSGEYSRYYYSYSYFPCS